MSDLTVDQVQEELRRGIDFFRELDQQILALLGRLAEVLEEHDLVQVKPPFAKNDRNSSTPRSYLLILKPSGADLEADDTDDDDDGGEDGEDANDNRELTFPKDSKLPYVLVQLIGKPSSRSDGAASAPFIQYGTLSVIGRKDGKPLDDSITMRGAYLSALFRNRVCNPKRKPPYSHKPKRGAATLRFDEGPCSVAALATIRTDEDIELLAKKIADCVGAATSA